MWLTVNRDEMLGTQLNHDRADGPDRPHRTLSSLGAAAVVGLLAAAAVGGGHVIKSANSAPAASVAVIGSQPGAADVGSLTLVSDDETAAAGSACLQREGRGQADSSWRPLLGARLPDSSISVVQSGKVTSTPVAALDFVALYQDSSQRLITCVAVKAGTGWISQSGSSGVPELTGEHMTSSVTAYPSIVVNANVGLAYGLFAQGADKVGVFKDGVGKNTLRRNGVYVSLLGVEQSDNGLRVPAYDVSADGSAGNKKEARASENGSGVKSASCWKDSNGAGLGALAVDGNDNSAAARVAAQAPADTTACATASKWAGSDKP